VSGRRIVVGIGNPDRGDDGAGRLVAQRLSGVLPAEVAVIEHDGEAASLLDRLDGVHAAFLIDACLSGQPSGTVRRVDVDAEALPDLQFGLSTHGFGLAEAIALGKALGSLPPRCVIFAIEAASFETGAALSPAVADAVETVAATVRDEVMQDA
jgi:hydrogenase maturation protease